MKTKIILMLSMIILMGGVMATSYLPGCWEPTLLGNISAYSFVSGYANYNTSSYSITLSSGDFDAAANSRMGTTGFSLVLATQQQDASRNRLFQSVWYDPSTARNYYVGQYSASGTSAYDMVMAIPDLLGYSNGSIMWYYPASSASSTAYAAAPDEPIIATTGNNTIVKFWDWERAGANMYNRIYKSGVGEIYFYGFCDNGVGADTNDYWSSTSEGWVNVARNLVGGCSGNTNYQDVSPDNATWYRLRNWGGVNGQVSGMNYYYTCGSNTGNVTFYAYEGSDSCGAYGSVPNVTCTIEGDTWTIPASTSNVVSTNETIPNFKDSEEYLSGYWQIHPWAEEKETPDDMVVLMKAREHRSQLSLRPWNARGGQDLWEIYQGEGAGQVQDTYDAMIIRYESPSGSVANVPLNSIIINTTLELNDLPCRDELLWGVDNYTINWFVGVNATYFKRSGYQCVDGVASVISPTYGTDLTALGLDDKGIVLAGKLKTAIADFAPIWIDTEENTINRFAYFSLEFGSNTRAMYDGDLWLGDNENFLMNYNYTNYTLESVTSDAYGYGTYFYQCEIPSGFIAVSNSSGYLTIDSPMESVSLILQKVVAIALNLTITREGTPATNAICTADISNGVVTTADTDGVCRFENIPIDTTIGVEVTHPGIHRSGTFQIGDYYNSEGYGEGVSCASFQDAPDYLYSWDIEREFATFTAMVKSKASGLGVDNADVYWDDEKVGVTQNGQLTFNVGWEFVNHELVVIHSQFEVGNASVRLTDSPYTMSLVGNSTYDADASALGTKTRADFLGMFSSMAFLGLILITATAGAGFMYGGLAGGAMAASMAAALMALTGMLPWSWGALIIFLGLVIGIGGSSSGGIVGLVSGGKK